MTNDQYHSARRKGIGLVRSSRPDQCAGECKSYGEASADIARLNGQRAGYWMACRCACGGWVAKQKEVTA